METKAVDFVQYTVKDLEAAIPFYRETLGLELEAHIEDFGWAEFALPPTTLALNELDGDEGIEPDGSGGAVAIAVDDVETAVEEIQAGGQVVYQEPVETGVCEMATVADPDGNPILLHRRKDGTHGRRDPLP